MPAVMVLFETPDGEIGPFRDVLFGPVGVLVLVAGGAGDDIGFERVGADVYIGDGLLDFRHVAPDALGSGATHLVIGVRHRLDVGVAGLAEGCGRFDEIRIIGSAVDIVAGGAFDAV